MVRVREPDLLHLNNMFVLPQLQYDSLTEIANRWSGSSDDGSFASTVRHSLIAPLAMLRGLSVSEADPVPQLVEVALAELVSVDGVATAPVFVDLLPDTPDLTLPSDAENPFAPPLVDVVDQDLAVVVDGDGNNVIDNDLLSQLNGISVIPIEGGFKEDEFDGEFDDPLFLDP
jgi:hypothetical protein